MKVQLLVSLTSDTLSWRPGDLLEVDEAEAKRLVDAEYAIAIVSDPETGESKRSRIKERR